MKKQNSKKDDPIMGMPDYSWNNRVVLITEDEEVNFYYLKTLLQRAEAKVLRAKNGQEAVEIISEYEGGIDLILMDLNMPVMDGYEAMRIIKSRHPVIPIIAQTAYTISHESSNSKSIFCFHYH